jgi:hypothetical protein
MVADGRGALPGNILRCPVKALKAPKSLKNAKKNPAALLPRVRAAGSCQ